MCKSHFFSREQFYPNTEDTITAFHEHLIFEDKKKVIYCYVPKVCVCVCVPACVCGGVCVCVCVGMCVCVHVCNRLYTTLCLLVQTN